VSADQIVILILLLALTVKFVFFEDKDERMADPSQAEADELNSSLRRRFAPQGYADKGCDG
jgi:hypothetical protein